VKRGGHRQKATPLKAENETHGRKILRGNGGKKGEEITAHHHSASAGGGRSKGPAPWTYKRKTGKKTRFLTGLGGDPREKKRRGTNYSRLRPKGLGIVEISLAKRERGSKEF